MLQEMFYRWTMPLNASDSSTTAVKKKTHLCASFTSIWVTIHSCEKNNSNHNAYFYFWKHGIFDYVFVSGTCTIRHAALLVRFYFSVLLFLCNQVTDTHWRVIYLWYLFKHRRVVIPQGIRNVSVSPREHFVWMST